MINYPFIIPVYPSYSGALAAAVNVCQKWTKMSCKAKKTD